MAEYLIKESSLTQMADAVRAMTGTTGKLKLDALEAKMTESSEDIGEATELIEQITEALEGKAAGGGSGDNDVLDAIIGGTITEIENDRITSLRSAAFNNCRDLTTALFPICRTIGSSAFGHCIGLKIVSFPICRTIGDYAFATCSRLTTVSFPQCTIIGSNAFLYCKSLTTISFPNCTTIGNYAFYNCQSLATASFPVCIIVEDHAFYQCSNLLTVSFPECETIGSNAFVGCDSLTTVSLPKCTTIGSYAFDFCRTLTSLTLANTTICRLNSPQVFTNTPIDNGTGYVYVPYALVSSYKTATNWARFSNQIFAIPGSEDWEIPEAAIITFAIDDTEYQTRKGVTWAEWVNSDYNTDAYYIIDDSYVCQAGTNDSVVANNDGYVEASALIIANESYWIEPY